MTHHSFVSALGVVPEAVRTWPRSAALTVRDRLRHRIRELLDLDGLEQYVAEADLRWHAMLDDLGYPPLRDRGSAPDEPGRVGVSSDEARPPRPPSDMTGSHPQQQRERNRPMNATSQPAAPGA